MEKIYPLVCDLPEFNHIYIYIQDKKKERKGRKKITRGFPLVIPLSEHIYWYEVEMEDRALLSLQPQLLLELS